MNLLYIKPQRKENKFWVKQIELSSGLLFKPFAASLIIFMHIKNPKSNAINNNSLTETKPLC